LRLMRDGTLIDETGSGLLSRLEPEDLRLFRG
jgi:hypothetical protein